MRQRNMTRVNVYLDETTLSILEKWRGYGIPGSAIIRQAVKQYDRLKRQGQYQPQSWDGIDEAA